MRDMPRNLWAVVVILAIVLGYASVRLHWFAANAGTYAVLALFMALILFGIWRGLGEGRRAVERSLADQTRNGGGGVRGPGNP